jgi:phosphatidate cytidylyltransferase
MALHWPTFFTRLGSAIVFSIIMMAGLLWNEWAFLILTALIQTLCLREYFRLLGRIFPDVVIPSWVHTLTQLFSLALLLIFAYSAISGQATLFPALLFFPALMLLPGILSKQTSFAAVLQGFGGLFYIALPMLLFFALRNISIIIPLALVLMIWMNDTMAYLVGSFIGKTPFSKISPKKTWEGTAGGAVLTIVGAAIWGFYSPYYHMVDWMVLALCASVAGTAGDLLESKLKRMADVKDSGTMMPGHGGALDRFDSLLIAIPFAFSYAYVFMEQVSLAIF